MAPEVGSERVLVIEDDSDTKELLTFNLQAAGFAVRAAGRASDGLTEVRRFAPDLVLLDLVLPDMPGTEVCRRIRISSSAHQPAIVMLTALADENDRVLGFQLGADDYVVKPFSMRELVLRVTAQLRSRRSVIRSASTMTRLPFRYHEVGPLKGLGLPSRGLLPHLGYLHKASTTKARRRWLSHRDSSRSRLSPSSSTDGWKTNRSTSNLTKPAGSSPYDLVTSLRQRRWKRRAGNASESP